MRLVFACCCSALLAAHADVLETTDGRRFEGTVHFLADAVSVKSASTEQRLPIAQVQLIRLPAKPQPWKFPAWMKGTLPVGWQSADIGRLEFPGTARFDEGRFILTSTGRIKDETREHLHFVFHPLTGDGEIIARLAMMELGSKSRGMYFAERAGLALRSGFTASSTNAVLTMDGTGKITLRQHMGRGGSAKSKPGAVPDLKGWLKLKRSGLTVAGFFSVDGKDWELLGEMKYKALPEQLHAGLVVQGLREDTTRAVFEELRLTRAALVMPAPPRVVLRNGSVIAWPFDAVDESAVKFIQPPPGLTVTTVNVARIEFQRLPREEAAGLPGVWQRDGQFLHGQFKGLAEGRVQLSSPTLGLRNLDAPGEATVMVLGKEDPVALPWIVVCQGQTVLHAQSIEPIAGGLRVVAPMAGQPVLPQDMLLEIRRTAPKK